MKAKKKTVYLDYASATPIDSGALRVLIENSKKVFANPSALHRLGVEAKKILEESRIRVAQELGAHADEIVFVSGGTESDNLALLGVVSAFKKKYPNIRPHIIVSSIEHSAVKASAEVLQEWGVDVSILPVNQAGIADVKQLRKLMRPETILVSVMMANNEIGTIEPVMEIAKEVRHARRHKQSDSRVGAPYPLFHTDASQALNYISIAVEKLGADLVTINGSKIYGPKGTGALYIKRRTPIAQIMFGGDQEFGLRPGTESLPAVAAFSYAVALAGKLRSKESARLTKLRDYLITKLIKVPYSIRINGSLQDRLPNNVNISVSGYQGETLVLYLDAQGICVSARSACKSTDPESSHVIKALGYDDEDAETGSIRISLGRDTTKQHLDYFVTSLVQILKLLAR